MSEAGTTRGEKKRDFTKKPITPAISVRRRTYERLQERAKRQGMSVTETLDKLICGALAVNSVDMFGDGR